MVFPSSLDIGYWTLDIQFCSFCLGYWLLVIGYWIFGFVPSALDIGYWIFGFVLSSLDIQFLCQDIICLPLIVSDHRSRSVVYGVRPPP
jgi:hypothetical protein